MTTAMCPAKFTCCELISVGISWYCNCYAKSEADCQADVASKGGMAWKVPACPPAAK